MEDRLRLEPRDGPKQVQELSSEEDKLNLSDAKERMKKRASRRRIAQGAKEKLRESETERLNPENEPAMEAVASEASEAPIDDSIAHPERSETPLRSTEAEPAELQKFTRQKQKKKQVRKQMSRLRFDDEPVLHGGEKEKRSVSPRNVAPSLPEAASSKAHQKIAETEDDNLGVKAAHKTELVTEQGVRAAGRKLERESKHHEKSPLQQKKTKLEHAEGQAVSKLSFEQEGTERIRPERSQMQKAAQKKRIKRQYADSARKRRAGTGAASAVSPRPGIAEKLSNGAKSFARNNKGTVAVVAVAGTIVILFASVFGAFGTMYTETEGAIMETTYLAEDQAIWDAEAMYVRWEEELQHQIDNVRIDHPGYDEYRFQIDEISHNPYHLISYLTLRYGAFSSGEVRSEEEELFRQQYRLSFQEDSYTETTTKTVRVGESLGQVVTSGYCNCALCCGSWAGGPTASGVYPRSNHTIAVDGNHPFVPLGTHVVMNGIEYVVEDTGDFDRFGVQFDVYYDDHASAEAHGHRTWNAVLADSNGSRTVQVTETRTVRRLSVTLTNGNLDLVVRSKLNEEDASHYMIYNSVYGNRSYLFPIQDLPSYGGMSYDIPPEALSDARFAAMIREAEKYLGRPYVWGGGSPDTGFDCSGYVSWVVNHCGNGWDFGRLSAEGLRNVCTYVTPDEAKPGDLVFFQGTYDTPGASHCAIYVGNGMMIHCGNPIQYTSMQSSYWQQHFYCFGRLP